MALLAALTASGCVKDPPQVERVLRSFDGTLCNDACRIDVYVMKRTDRTAATPNGVCLASRSSSPPGKGEILLPLSQAELHPINVFVILALAYNRCTDASSSPPDLRLDAMGPGQSDARSDGGASSCGNSQRVCDDDKGETCANCPQDCRCFPGTCGYALETVQRLVDEDKPLTLLPLQDGRIPNLVLANAGLTEISTLVPPAELCP